MSEALLTTEEAAAYLRLTPRALLSLRHRRVAPPAAKVGRKLVWPADELERWLQSRIGADEPRIEDR